MTDAPPRHGFSVAALAPFRGGRGALRLGLAALADDLWRDTGPGLAPCAAAKAAVWRVPADEARHRGTTAYRDALGTFAGHAPG